MMMVMLGMVVTLFMEAVVVTIIILINKVQNVSVSYKSQTYFTGASLSLRTIAIRCLTSNSTYKSKRSKGSSNVPFV